MVILSGHIMPKSRKHKPGRVSEAAISPPVLSASAFKARCLELMDLVAAGKGEIVVTKRGQPVVKVVPVRAKVHDIIGYLKGTVTYHGDIVGPTGERWNAEED
jgi:prevent-host-death family protein